MSQKSQWDKPEYFIYIVLSETPTGFGRVIRYFGKIKYNHASIAFDEKLRQLYSFGRRQYKNPLNAGLIREYPERFSLRRFSRVNVRIYRISVTREQYLLGKNRIREIRHDRDGYLYNLFSVLSFPLLKGFHTYKAYSCAEFVAHMVRTMGITLGAAKPDSAFTPEEIGDRVESRPFFEGNLLDYCASAPYIRDCFFDDPGYVRTARTSCALPFRLLYRKIRFRNKFAAVM
ncbi:hypothetical protein SAMN02745823_00355 [Sporobacter termitidis DSM 10068]|uniref:Permuted papain-like amidase enzyme, YaeF/YiiX, C92 family n=1 Tax=Sporobacter termitidis DSM 10068 TaxID=1123282 RepID=A0A1M5U4V1_9FIRM|nr:hypothetical protein [Sporobacter termitidis]SHH57891.1 hypothetical protein SAMN02745823_00355 [Sporobacter termitidis DSM 10068]